MKKYSIVRVDGRCPSWCGDSSKVNCIVCDFKDKKCKNCRYGDTKEQLLEELIKQWSAECDKRNKGE